MLADTYAFSDVSSEALAGGGVGSGNRMKAADAWLWVEIIRWISFGRIAGPTAHPKGTESYSPCKGALHRHWYRVQSPGRDRWARETLPFGLDSSPAQGHCAKVR